MPKVGRNDPCPCQSGHKYKHCHGSFRFQAELREAAIVARDQFESREAQRKKQQGLGNPIVSAQTPDGSRLVAVKSRLLHSRKWKSFHDFLGDYIKIAMGSEWGNAELAKPYAERHPILQWYQDLCQLQAIHITKPGDITPIPPSGAAKAYLHLAYDLYALEHNIELQDKLINRLKNRDNFLGARYEVFVAAKMIRAGFALVFEDEDDRDSSHCEFTATSIKTGKKFSVEAKCRSGTKNRIGRLLSGALQKKADHPRVVFIEMNIPNVAVGWPPEIDYAVSSALHQLEWKKLNGESLPAAYLFVTNFPWAHHRNDTDIGCAAFAYGFQLPDFMPSRSISLREAIVFRDKHIEMHELARFFSQDQLIPSTFDGEIPVFAFGSTKPRLLVGGRYEVPDESGNLVAAVLTDAVVVEERSEAACVLVSDSGNSLLVSWPLSDAEMDAWRQHPDTFFGRLETNKRIKDPLEMYDFLREAYRNTPKDRLLEFMAIAPDIAELKLLDQAKLVEVYAERMAATLWAAGPPEQN